MTVIHPEGEIGSRRGLRGFMDRGGFWRMLAFLAVNFGITVSIARTVNGPFAGFVELVGLIALTLYLGLADDLFGRQRIYASGWMWIAPALVLAPIMLRIFGTGWGDAEKVALVPMVLFGLMVGFVEELVYRGYAVKMLRVDGHGELVVALVTSTLFGLAHIPMLLSEDNAVGRGVLASFAFGVLMYLTMRATGHLIWAIVLHAFYDIAIWMADGWQIRIPSPPASDELLHAAADLKYGLIIAAVVLLLCIRGWFPSPGNPDQQDLPAHGRKSTLVSSVKLLPPVAGVGLALLAISSFADTNEFNESHWLDRKLEKRVLDYSGLQVKTKCPDGVHIEQGKTFTCIQTNPDGSTLLIDVTFKNNKGDTRARWNPAS